MIDRIEELRAEAEAAIAGAAGSAELEELRVRYLGRKAELPQPAARRRAAAARGARAAGKAANEARKALEALIERARRRSSRPPSSTRGCADDASTSRCPARRRSRSAACTSSPRRGARSRTSSSASGFAVAEGPEVETVYYNFDALNHAVAHPARDDADTFYVADDVVCARTPRRCRSRAMERSRRRSTSSSRAASTAATTDATHTPQFHQVEGLAVDEDVTLADLKGTLLAFARAIFGDERDVRLRPHFFPFTEPCVEVDVSCFNCKDGDPRDGSRCPVCKGDGWIEILGAGEVDPNVFGYVREHGYDPERVQGFAFGMGIERIAMLKHGVPDLRLFYDNDLRFLEQFG